MRILLNTVMLTCKRSISHMSFWVGILLLPFLICGISYLTSDTITDWNIALLSEEDGLAQQAIDELCEQDSFFHFYQCSSLEELQEDIMAKRTECGFYFQDGFEEAFYNNDFDEQIMVYYAPSTIADKAARENVFSAVLKQANQTILQQFFTQETGIVPDETTYQELYEKYANNGNIFHFAYEELEGNGTGVEQNSILLSPERGIMAIYLWAIGLFSVLSIYEDEKNGIYPLLKKRQRVVLKNCTVGIPVATASLTGVLGLTVSGKIQNLALELGALLLYAIVITLFSLSLQNIWRKPGYYSCFVTLLLTASVVFCPVFISIGQFFPTLTWIQKIFIPDYYLEIFVQNNKIEMVFGIIGNIVLYEIVRLIHKD